MKGKKSRIELDCMKGMALTIILRKNLNNIINDKIYYKVSTWTSVKRGWGEITLKLTRNIYP